ncbi:hypothetical protein ACJMK2_006208 [Sinanodonta woodiana]|uniref:C2H2-type domain-containing protein n=1 Tax=Sinanodonta woodiana TaxID=1069815 RepID=A0ABD3VSF4_SINWO
MTTRLISVKSLTNTRGRAYRCRRCPAEDAIIGEKSKVVNHIYKKHIEKHIALDQAPFYCSLCTFKCQYQHDLERHVRYYSAHREKANLLREMGCHVNEEANLFQNLHPYLPGDSDMEVLGHEDSEQIWRKIPPRRCEHHKLSTIIMLAHPAAHMMLAEAGRSSSRLDNSSAQSEVNFLHELLDCGSPINFSQRKAHHRQTPRNIEPKDAFKLAEQPNMIAVEWHQQLAKLVAGIDTLKYIMETKVEMLRKNNTQLTALMVNLTDAIQEQTNTYRTLNNNITKMIEHLNDTNKPHPKEDGCKNRFWRKERKKGTLRDNQRENRSEWLPMRYKHRHSPY